MMVRQLIFDLRLNSVPMLKILFPKAVPRGKAQYTNTDTNISLAES